MTTKSSQTLPHREQALFKSVCKHYESKCFKKGLKAADQILKNFPNHGETLSMKGLLLLSGQKKKEGLEFIKNGLMKNLQSHVCWHVYGLYHRNDRNYIEAIKCYRNAMKHDKDNQQILRDLSLLQVQMRDNQGYMETSRQLLVLKPTQLVNWIRYSLACHLAGSLQTSAAVLSKFMELPHPRTETSFEVSELLLYKAMLLEEQGDNVSCLEHLEKEEKRILDRQAMLEQQGRVYLQMQRMSDAESAYRSLIDTNPECLEYHEGLLKACGVNPLLDDTGLQSQQLHQVQDIYSSFSAKYPKCDICWFLSLKYATGTNFESVLDTYMRPRLRNGMASLFMTVKPIYSNAWKVSAIEKMVMNYLDSLEKNGCFPRQAHFCLYLVCCKFDHAKDVLEPPTSRLWTYHYLGFHFSHLHQQEKALSYIDVAIEQAPTVIDFLTCKARILKRAGSLGAAADMFDEARRMDLADRYLNTRTARYALRADRPQQAFSTAALFLKDGDDPRSSLSDMQCMWFEYELGMCYMRLRQYGKALKAFLDTEKHFVDIVEDQFDFHYFCLRKMTLRAYVCLMRSEDAVYAHKYYRRAALSMIKTYVQIFDAPAKKDEDESMSEAERKRREKQKSRAERKRKAEEERAKVKQGSSKIGVTRKGAPKKDDADPEGLLLEQVEDPLLQATKYVQSLKKHSPGYLDVHMAAFEVYIRRRKYLLALSALKRATQLADSPLVWKNVCIFLHTVDSDRSVVLSAVVRQVLDAERSLLESYRERWELESTPPKPSPPLFNSLSHLLAVAQISHLCDPENKLRCVELVLRAIEAASSDSTPIEDYIRAYDFLKNEIKDEGSLEKMREMASFKFPLAQFCLHPDEQHTLDEKTKTITGDRQSEDEEEDC